MTPTGSGYFRGDHDPARAAPISVGTAPAPTSAPIANQDIGHRIVGHELQFLEIDLGPGESVIAEPGALVWKDFEIDMSTTLSDGSQEDEAIIRKLLGAGKRALLGEGLFTVTFTNQGVGQAKTARIAFSAPFPGNIVPLRLADYDGRVICQKQSFLAAARGVKVGLKLIPGITTVNGHSRARAVMTGMFGGEGFLMQVIEGTGWAFVHMGGTVIEHDIAGGERIHVDPGCVAAYTDGVDYTIVSAGAGIRSKMFGGEGFILAALTGPGKVWIQSMPMTRLMAQIAAAGGAASATGELAGEAVEAAGKAAMVGAAGLAGIAGVAALTDDNVEDGLLGQFGKLCGD
ncbi:MAG: AIM24 family protein [Sphingopyxis sp.]|nr:AIM24 family protein [Sphingopyxis sp.]